jgi:DNA-binding transcriptional LysR family regulator
MDIRLIRAFVTLAQLRRYHAAAERLCLTQPALTKQIQTLEHLTGMTLFQRGRQGAQLTAAGEAIYSQACHFVAQHDQFCAWTEQVRRGNVGTLALGFGISTFQLAPAQVKAFRQQFPDIDVSLNDIASHEQYRMLLEGQLHAGFVRMPVPDALEAQALMEESLVLAVPAGATEALPDIASVLRQFPLLQINPRRGRGWQSKRRISCKSTACPLTSWRMLTIFIRCWRWLPPEMVLRCFLPAHVIFCRQA